MPATIGSTLAFHGVGHLESFPPAHLALTALLCTTIFYLLRQLLFHPLRAIPGPLLARVSPFPLFIESIKGNRMNWIVAQHNKHGPVIRIAPGKVCVADQSGIKAIYSNKAMKSSMYQNFMYKDTPMCIGLLTVKAAHQRRKALLPAFSRQVLIEMEPVIRSHLITFLNWLETFDERKEAIDAFKWFRYLTFDVVADVAFGQRLNLLGSGDSHFTEMVELRNKRNSLNGPFPFILPILKFFKSKIAEDWTKCDDEIAGYAIRARNGWATAGEAGRHRVDILSRIDEGAKTSPDTALSEDEVIASMMELLNAGSDTTANTAMFTSWELSQNLDVQAKLHAELLAAFPDPSQPLDVETLEKLPYLDGVVKEGLRIHAPLPAFLERLAPPGGLNICGYDIPEGTVVGMQAYTNHRDENVYPDARVFIPERWADQTPAMKLNFLPFSNGPRACVGLNLANMQLRIHLGHIFRRYKVTAPPQTTKESMEHVEFFAVRPKGMKCMLNFNQYEE